MSILPKSPGEMGAPNTITSVDDPATSTNNALIGYENLLANPDVADAAKMLIPNTYERYLVPSGSSSVDFILSQPTELNYIAFAAHNLGTHLGGVNVTVLARELSTQNLYTIYNHKPPIDNTAIMASFSPDLVGKIYDKVAILFSSPALGASLGVFYAGNSLEMQRSIYGGHSPADLSQKTSYQSTMSESGQFLGRTVTRRGSETSFKWRHLEPDWYRDNFQPFVQSAITKPFFIQWKPSIVQESPFFENYSAFGFTTGDIKPTNMGGGSDLMSVSFNFKGHSD